jgi:ATP phosphoribosyltransferase
MSRRTAVNRIMDELHGIGARGIIVTDIRTCRL